MKLFMMKLQTPVQSVYMKSEFGNLSFYSHELSSTELKASMEMLRAEFR